MTFACQLGAVDQDLQVFPDPWFLLGLQTLLERGQSRLARLLAALLVAGLEIEDLGVEARHAHAPGLLGGELREHLDQDLRVGVAALDPFRLLRLRARSRLRRRARCGL